MAALVLAGCGSDAVAPVAPVPAHDMIVTSAAFTAGQRIPREFTCDGANTWPPLAWSGTPPGSAELVLTVRDPDAPGGDFVHWLLYGLDGNLTHLEAGTLPAGVRQGRNSRGEARYTGPCPPPGSPHRYVFRLVALSAASGLGDGASAAEVEDAVRARGTSSGELVGIYGR